MLKLKWSRKSRAGERGKGSFRVQTKEAPKTENQIYGQLSPNSGSATIDRKHAPEIIRNCGLLRVITALGLTWPMLSQGTEVLGLR